MHTITSPFGGLGGLFLYHECGVGASETEGVAQDGVYLGIGSHGGEVEMLGVFVRILEVDVRSGERALHHNERIDYLRRTCHPALVARHALRRRDEGVASAEHTVEGDGLVHIALMCGGGVGVDVIDIVETDAGILQGA